MVRLSFRELQNAPDAIPESAVEPPPLDTAWVEATRKKALLKLEKLDTDLKNYKGNSIKESIRCWPVLGRGRGGQLGWLAPRPGSTHCQAYRRGHDDLGDHYLDCGDLSNALKCYSRARDYCTSAKHVTNMCLNVIKVAWAVGGRWVWWAGPQGATPTESGLACSSARSVSTCKIGHMC